MPAKDMTAKEIATEAAKATTRQVTVTKTSPALSGARFSFYTADEQGGGALRCVVQLGDENVDVLVSDTMKDAAALSECLGRVLVHARESLSK